MAKVMLLMVVVAIAILRRQDQQQRFAIRESGVSADWRELLMVS